MITNISRHAALNFLTQKLREVNSWIDIDISQSLLLRELMILLLMVKVFQQINGNHLFQQKSALNIGFCILVTGDSVQNPSWEQAERNVETVLGCKEYQ